MKLKTLQGKEYSIQPIDYITNNEGGKSKGHLLVRKLIKEIFIAEWILEEVPVKIGPKKTLYLDFLLKSRQIAIEVQGPQHKEFVQAFHETQAGFRESVVRDQLKKDWCEVNNLTLIELHYGEEDEWRKRLCEI